MRRFSSKSRRSLAAVGSLSSSRIARYRTYQLNFCHIKLTALPRYQENIALYLNRCETDVRGVEDDQRQQRERSADEIGERIQQRSLMRTTQRHTPILGEEGDFAEATKLIERLPPRYRVSGSLPGRCSRLKIALRPKLGRHITVWCPMVTLQTAFSFPQPKPDPNPSHDPR